MQLARATSKSQKCDTANDKHAALPPPTVSCESAGTENQTDDTKATTSSALSDVRSSTVITTARTAVTIKQPKPTDDKTVEETTAKAAPIEAVKQTTAKRQEVTATKEKLPEKSLEASNDENKKTPQIEATRKSTDKTTAVETNRKSTEKSDEAETAKETNDKRPSTNIEDQLLSLIEPEKTRISTTPSTDLVKTSSNLSKNSVNIVLSSSDFQPKTSIFERFGTTSSSPKRVRGSPNRPNRKHKLIGDNRRLSVEEVSAKVRAKIKPKMPLPVIPPESFYGKKHKQRATSPKYSKKTFINEDATASPLSKLIGPLSKKNQKSGDENVNNALQNETSADAKMSDSVFDSVVIESTAAIVVNKPPSKRVLQSDTKNQQLLSSSGGSKLGRKTGRLCCESGRERRLMTNSSSSTSDTPVRPTPPSASVIPTSEELVTFEAALNRKPRTAANSQPATVNRKRPASTPAADDLPITPVSSSTDGQPPKKRVRFNDEKLFQVSYFYKTSATVCISSPPCCDNTLLCKGHRCLTISKN